MDIIHVNLQVSDVKESVQFYAKELGFEETWGFESPDGRTTHRYVADGNGTELQLSETDGDAGFDTGGGFQHLAVEVDDVDDIVARLNHYGLEKAPADQPEAGARTAFILDPDGYAVELVKPLEE